MNTMASVVGVGLIFGIFSMLVPIALLVVLQVWLCRKGKWLGVILPVLSLLLSLLLVFSMGTFQAVGRGGSSVITYSENGQTIQEHH